MTPPARLRTALTILIPFASVPFLLSATTASPADTAFVGKVSQGGAYEVAASQLATQRAKAWDVRDLAIAEVHDHTGVGQRLKAVSTQGGLTIAPNLNAEFTERLAKLRATPPDAFDAAYIEDMKQIHDKDEKLFAAEAQEGSDAFKSFAHSTDLIVKRHIGALHGLDQ